MSGLVVVVVGLFLYPLVRSMRSTMRELADAAQQVSEGHFGAKLNVERSDELGTVVRAFNDMSMRLAEAEELNARLLHDVSHELRSPLGRIQAMAEMMDHRPKRAAECIHGINQEIALLDRLVGDLVESARIESNAEQSFVGPFSLHGWIQEVLDRLESKVRAHHVDWSVQRLGVDREICGDLQRLAQAVGNLVDNAIDAVEGWPQARIDVTIDSDDDRWSMTVCDNGCGIPADALPHVFRRFFRADDHRGRDRGGVGLGLSLVQAIAESHGGEATVCSVVEQGTSVTLSVPHDAGLGPRDRRPAA